MSVLAQPLAAQIVNIEEKRNIKFDTIDWGGYVDLKFNLVDNGTSSISISGDTRIEHVHLRHLFLSFTRYNLGKVEGKDFINNGFQHFRYNYKMNSLFVWEAFTQVQYNELIKLRLRWLLGTGPRIQLLNQNKSRVFFGLMYMFEYDEEYFETLDVTDFHRDHRISSYFSYYLEPTEQFSIAGTTYIQPVINELSDIRISTQTNFLFKISERLQFSTAFSLTYDSDVPEGVLNTIYRLTNGLRWNF